MAESVHLESDDCVGDLHEAEELCENFSILTILDKGTTFNYVIPSFPIFNADIIEVKLQLEEIC